MFEVFQSDEFSAWLAGLRDRSTRARIQARIDRMAGGNLGDVAPIGEGLSEARIHHGAGYRVYFKQQGQVLLILLCGGDKSTQQRDIEQAKQLMQTWEEANNDPRI